MTLKYRLMCFLGIHRWCYHAEVPFKCCLRCGKVKRTTWAEAIRGQE